jgi:5-methylcytosine-specific restriction endonuclease McrA
MAKKTTKKYDPVAKLRNAAREIWRGSPMRREAKKRVMVDKENAHCEICSQVKPIELFQVDHVIDATPSDSILTLENFGEFVLRLFCPTEGLVAICKKCHKIKTKETNAIKRALLKKAKK